MFSSLPVLAAAILAIAIPLQLLRAYRPDKQTVDRWAHSHDLELTADNRPIVARYLRSARVLRTWGAVAGAIGPSLIEFAVNGRVQVLGFGTDGRTAPLAFGTIFIGYLIGALVAELSLVRRVDGTRRTASLARRELQDYLPHRIVVAQRVLAITGAVGGLAIGLLPYPDSVSNPGMPSLMLIAVSVLAFAAGLEMLERWLLHRAQPFTSPPLVAADDAIRAQSVHAMAGAGIALLALYCSGVSLALQGSAVTALHWSMAAPAAAFLILSLTCCQGISQGSWRVPRRARAVSAAST